MIQARVTVRAASSARVQPGFSPYEVLGSRSESSRRGGVVTTVWTFDLQCLEPECAPGKAARHIAVSPSRVLVGSRVVAARFQPSGVSGRRSSLMGGVTRPAPAGCPAD